ncbi:MAG: hypothetical protein U0105_09685 [Candidatus Obscuribacterales bacterium]
MRQEQCDGSARDFSIYSDGFSLTPDEALALEERLLQNSQDVPTRLKLLGYYLFSSESEAASRWSSNFKWMIRNRPGDWICGNSGPPDSIANSDLVELVDSWSEVTTAQPDDPMVIGRAGQFLCGLDDDRAENLLRRAEILEPNNSAWSRSLLQLFISMASSSEHGRSAELTEVFDQAEIVLRKEDHPGERYGALLEVSDCALEAGELAKGKIYAEQLLALTIERETSHRQFVAHTLLGLIAIKQDDAEAAEKQLLAAGDCEFCPDMRLAHELFLLKRTEPVLRFLKACERTAPEAERKQLRTWHSEVEQGKTPNLIR